MQIGMIGLGRMGSSMVRRLITGGHECVVFNRTPEKIKALVAEGAVGAESFVDLDAEAVPKAERVTPVVESIRPVQRLGQQQRLRQLLLVQLSCDCRAQKYFSHAMSRRRAFRRENHAVGK